MGSRNSKDYLTSIHLKVNKKIFLNKEQRNVNVKLPLKKKMVVIYMFLIYRHKKISYLIRRVSNDVDFFSFQIDYRVTLMQRTITTEEPS